MMPIVRRFMEHKQFGTLLDSMTEVDARAFKLMQDILDTKARSEEPNRL